MTPPLFVGIDLGTSGCRAVAIDEQGHIHAEARTSMPNPIRADKRVEQNASQWWLAVTESLNELLTQISPSLVKTLAVDGTSGTLLLADDQGQPIGPALMYNDARSEVEANQISRYAPRESAAHGSTSALAKFLHLKPGLDVHYALHQADWIIGKLTDKWGISDVNNCLKLGFDPVNTCWPEWLDQLDIDRKLLPDVMQPGTPIGQIRAEIAAKFGLSANTLIVAGTTDSTAAFIATGADQVGEAVTSLGSTLVLKVISEQPIFSPAHGVYSQPLGNLWLVGGGSNSGGAVLLHYFSTQQLADMTPSLNPEQSTGLDYYPLIQPGERFPMADRQQQARLIPRPDDDVIFFQAMLEGMATIEQQGYQLLAELGAPYPVTIRSAGGGSFNPAWTRIRQRLLGVPFIETKHQEAAYGSALLARQGYLSERTQST